MQAHGHELWHGVHFLLRDEHWRTPALRLGPVRHERMPDGWRAVVEGHFEVQPRVGLRLTVEGREDGRLDIVGEAWAEGDIAVNRLGLCLLHPDHAAGKAVAVDHTDGRQTWSTLPRQVPPWPPFSDIRALRHEVVPGVWACAGFEGEAFELEDQRNNADASFKTYSRSNFMPRPMHLRAGDAVRQRLQLSLQGTPRAAPPSAPRRLDADCPAGPPRSLCLGLEITAAELADPGRSAATARAARPDRLHLVAGPHDQVPMPALAHLLADSGVPLRLDLADLPASAAVDEVERWASRLAAAGIVPAQVAVFPSTPEAVAAARRAFGPGTRVGGGTADFFVQLNRQDRLPPLDFLSFTVCPIVHGADDDTVMASPRSLGPMLATLRARWPGVPVHVGPSRIAARRSPLGERAWPRPGERLALAGTDPRDGDAFGAAWSAAYLAAAVAAGAQGVTLGRLLQSAEGPMAELWRALAARRPTAGLCSLQAPPGLSLHGLGVIDPDGRVRPLLVNAGAESVELPLHGTDLPPHTLLFLP